MIPYERARECPRCYVLADEVGNEPLTTLEGKPPATMVTLECTQPACSYYRHQWKVVLQQDGMVTDYNHSPRLD